MRSHAICKRPYPYILEIRLCLEKSICVAEVMKNRTRIQQNRYFAEQRWNQYPKTLEEFTLLEWQHILDVSLTGAFLVSKAGVNGMISRRAGGN
jgi:NAD(P)-dependent dehydrogenase (short-subunit alcohol dehydrogenase family)